MGGWIIELMDGWIIELAVGWMNLGMGN